MPYNDYETPITYFANPFLRCTECGHRAVGMIGLPKPPNPGQGDPPPPKDPKPLKDVEPPKAAVGGGADPDLPTSGRNWPCYHQAPRESVCENWTSDTGCQHDQETQAEHSNGLDYEIVRR